MTRGWSMATTVLAAAMLGAALLAGCAPGGGTATTSTVTATVTATVTQTTTATVTAAPTAVPRSYDDPITALDAWQICSGAAYGTLPSGSTVVPYDPGPVYRGYAVTDQGDGTFEVLVGYGPPPDSGGFGGQIICTVSGTVGAPLVTVGGRDFG